jgi:hypothetical protein
MTVNQSIKRVSPVLLLILILVGGGIIVGALIFGDERGERIADRITDLTQPMEVKGDWLGISLVDLTSGSARKAGLPTNLKGVMVTDISESAGWRARAAGLMSRDVITGINRTKVSSINDLYDLVRKVNVSEPIALDVNRFGQVGTLTLAGLTAPGATFVAPGAMAAQGMPAQGLGQAPMQPMQAMAPAAMAPLPVAGINAQPVAQPVQYAGPRWICRRHGLAWPQQVVQPGFRCPYCNEPLTMTP